MKFTLPHVGPSFLKGIVACLLAVVFSASSYAVDKPNIIYILADDLGYGDLSCNGQKKFKTPHIDSLAAEGVKFTQHYSGSTVCAPARCSLMTGYHTGHTLVRGNREVKPEGQAPMPADTLTIPRLLKKAGYVSGGFGKWGLGAPGSSSDPAEHFDRFFGYNCQREAHNFYPNHLWSDKEKVPLDGKTYSHDVIQDEAFKFIRANKDKPFFCYLAIAIPHAAMQAPPELHNKWRKKYPEFEDKIGKYSHGTRVVNPIAAFPAMVEHMDNGVGQLLALLKELGIDDNTLVMFTSDNGPHKEGGHDPKFWDSNGDLTGFKRDLTEGGIRVPFLARWPAKIKPGTESDHQSAFYDMLPTLAELAGVDAPEGLDGISMVKALTGDTSQKKHEYLYWEFTERGGRQALRKGDWKAIRLNVAKDPYGPIELYNLKDDLGETKDLAKERPEIAEELTKLMDGAWTYNPNFPIGKRNELRK